MINRGYSYNVQIFNKFLAQNLDLIPAITYQSIAKQFQGPFLEFRRLHFGLVHLSPGVEPVIRYMSGLHLIFAVRHKYRIG